MKEEIDEMWIGVYENFKTYFPCHNDHVVSWYPSGYKRINLIFDDGMRMQYNDNNNTIRNLTNINESLVDDEERWTKIFSTCLRQRMIEACYDQTMMCEAIGVSQGSMSNYLTGKTIPNLLVCKRIANVLKCSIDDLTYFE